MKILVPVDFSKNTQTILDEALKIALKLNAKLCLLHVADSVPEFLGMEHGPQSPRDTLLRKHEESKKALLEIVDTLKNQDCGVESKWTTGPIIEMVLKEAKILKADMIVVGSHGHGAMYQILVGSVSEGILHQSDVPVLVVPTHER
ncbi:MAG: universal stress protein [Bacteroidetes bacterium]|nr:universal stress protein [Bacteroidota bacterium]